MVLVLWVELTGGIGYENGWQIDAVGFQKRIKRLMVVLLPYWIAIGRENQCIAHLVQVDSPVCAFGVLRVTERAEIFGVAAARLLVFFLNG